MFNTPRAPIKMMRRSYGNMFRTSWNFGVITPISLYKVRTLLKSREDFTDELYKDMCLHIRTMIKDDINDIKTRIKELEESISFKEDVLKKSNYILRKEKLERINDKSG